MNKLNSRSFNLGLVFLLAFNLLPHLASYTAPVILVGGICIVWRLLFEYQKVKLPHMLVKFLLVTICMTWVFLTYKSFLGLEAGTTVLIMAVSLKLIDRNNYHSAMVILFMSFIILLARVLEEQSLWVTLFGVVDLIIVTSLLMQIHSHDNIKFNAKELFVNGGILILKAAPLMILLFIVFPRLSYKLDILPSQAQSASSGFSDTIDPGSVAKVVLSNEIAFKAKIEKRLDLFKSNKYWKGAVLSKSKGMSWSKAKSNNFKSRINKDQYQSEIQQEIILKPRYNKWLFALDQPISLKLKSKPNSRLSINTNGTYSLKTKNKQHLLYEVTSARAIKTELTQLEKKLYLQLPKKIDNDPRMTQLIKQLKLDTDSTTLIASRLLEFYKNNFKYTINPGELKSDKVSDFIFESKTGFCEHFAASFAAIMRRINIPARVVIGFHGGEINSYDNYITVRDKDAHAWAEVWSAESKQWLRYDPTQVVAPLRIELGGQIYHDLTTEQLNQSLSSTDYINQYTSSILTKNWKQISLIIESIATKWNYFLVNYNQDQQKKLFSKFGLNNLKPVSLLILSVMVFLVFYLLVKKQFSITKKSSTVEEQYQELCKILEGKGHEKLPHVGAKTFLELVEKRNPLLKTDVTQFKRNYLLWRYSPYQPNRNEINLQKKLIKQIKTTKMES